MRIGVPKETVAGERRVALVPEVVRRLVGGGHVVVVEAGAGGGAMIPDAAFVGAGAVVTDDLVVVWGCEVVVKVAAPLAGEVVRLGRGSVLVGFLRPLTEGGGVRAVAAAGVTAVALEVVPR